MPHVEGTDGVLGIELGTLAECVGFHGTFGDMYVFCRVGVVWAAWAQIRRQASRF